MTLTHRGAFVALALTVLTACGPTAAPTNIHATMTALSESGGSKSGLATCRLSSLPPEASEVMNQIERGGPFDNPGKDGAVFGNYEGVLPKKSRGYYHEYTVATPGAQNRGTRRIVTGGKPLTDPPEAYYTGDHYTTFCEIEGR
jgi:guanyl-specific ribonuclease Sa